VSTIRIATIARVTFRPHSRKRAGRTEGDITMRGLKWAVPVAVAGAVAAGAVAVGTLQAQTPPPPIAVEVLTQRAVFTDDVELQIRNKLDGQATDVSNSRHPSRTVVAKITVQPGAQFPWHTHPGPVIVNIAQGELTYIMAHDCVDRPYAAGTAFVDPGRGMVHTAINRTGGVTVLLATFFEVPQTGPLTIPVEAPADCTP
jgi:quercetin dioxygenase-like cupin family protein